MEQKILTILDYDINLPDPAEYISYYVSFLNETAIDVKVGILNSKACHTFSYQYGDLVNVGILSASHIHFNFNSTEICDVCFY